MGQVKSRPCEGTLLTPLPKGDKIDTRGFIRASVHEVPSSIPAFAYSAYEYQRSVKLNDAMVCGIQP